MLNYYCTFQTYLHTHTREGWGLRGSGREERTGGWWNVSCVICVSVSESVVESNDTYVWPRPMHNYMATSEMVIFVDKSAFGRAIISTATISQHNPFLNTIINFGIECESITPESITHSLSTQFNVRTDRHILCAKYRFRIGFFVFERECVCGLCAVLVIIIYYVWWLWRARVFAQRIMDFVGCGCWIIVSALPHTHKELTKCQVPNTS